MAPAPSVRVQCESPLLPEDATRMLFAGFNTISLIMVRLVGEAMQSILCDLLEMPANTNESSISY